jgi:hypothetical protein
MGFIKKTTLERRVFTEGPEKLNQAQKALM